ncbi:PAS domain S-box protein [Streptomyces alboflavus]|uniref:PAS domain S-box protein n=1 Tax=Streptomyces alboflavus TaxID=67267 RepID=UPI0036765D55
MADVRDAETDEELEDLLGFLRDARGFDFTGYKRSSLGRRIRKRMSDIDVRSYADYRDRLETSADEFSALFNTILINVTSLFRDPDAWTFLQREVVPELLADKEPHEEIRVKSWNRGAAELWGLRADEVADKAFFELDFGLPTEELRSVVQRCVDSGKRTDMAAIRAVNRIGRPIVCNVVCSPFAGHHAPVVLLMEEGPGASAD